jgi:hypothetical protein
MAPAAPPASSRVFACGVTGSGKTSALRRLWLERSPRALILDATGEWLSDKGARLAHDWSELLAELRRAANRARWRIVAPAEQLDPAQVIELLLARGGAGVPYPRAVGGMALLVDELSAFAHNSCSHRVTAGWTRGRHAGLTILGASQFPAQVARAVTSQSEWWLVYSMHEPGDVAYLARALPPAVMQAHGALEQYHAVLWSTVRRAGWLLSPDYKLIRQLA